MDIKKEISENQLLVKLTELIKQRKGKVNPYEAALETGFSIDEINDGFKRLLEVYESRLKADLNTGTVEFIFTYPLVKRGRRTYKELLFEFANKAYLIFKKVYKISIGVVLIVYTVVFALLLLALMIAASTSDKNNRRSPNIALLVDIIYTIIRGMQIAYITGDLYEYRYDSSGLRYKVPRREPKKSFINSVYDFVFGPERLKIDDLSNTQEVLAFLQKVSNGKLTAGAISLLSGVSLDVAESKLAEYVGKFKGDLIINNDGTVVAEFPNLQKISSDMLQGKIVYYFDEIEEPYILNGNTSGKNFVIFIMNSFNLFFSYLILNSNIENPWIYFFLGIFPFIFSVLFFLIPLIRIPVNYYLNLKRQKNIIKKKLFRAIFKLNKHASDDEIISNADLLPEEKHFAKDLLNEMVIEYRGEIDIDQNGKPIYKFDKLLNDIKLVM